MTYLLAGDVGGTKSVLCLYQFDVLSAEQHTALQVVKRITYASKDYQHFRLLVADFLKQVSPHQPDHACFGIAGPIHEQRCEATNLPWVIDARALADEFSICDVFLLNDLEAAAYGMLKVPDEDLIELNPNAIKQQGHMAVLAAGTGLGEAIMAWDGNKHFVLSSEGGHCDFAPNSAQEDDLLKFLRERFKGHVSYERILAGDGFGNLYDYLKASGFAPADPVLEAEMQNADRNAVISRYGLEGNDSLCKETLRLFVEIYGNEAGNMALKCLPRGGVFIGGGIGPKIKSAMQNGSFLKGFLNKGRMTHAIEKIPVRLCLNTDTPLIGAAHQALERLLNHS